MPRILSRAKSWTGISFFQQVVGIGDVLANDTSNIKIGGKCVQLWDVRQPHSAPQEYKLRGSQTVLSCDVFSPHEPVAAVLTSGPESNVSLVDFRFLNKEPVSCFSLVEEDAMERPSKRTRRPHLSHLSCTGEGSVLISTEDELLLWDSESHHSVAGPFPSPWAYSFECKAMFGVSNCRRKAVSYSLSGQETPLHKHGSEISVVATGGNGTWVATGDTSGDVLLRCSR